MKTNPSCSECGVKLADPQNDGVEVPEFNPEKWDFIQTYICNQCWQEQNERIMEVARECGL